jgi:hypothetical protein
VSWITYFSLALLAFVCAPTKWLRLSGIGLLLLILLLGIG